MEHRAISGEDLSADIHTDDCRPSAITPALMRYVNTTNFRPNRCRQVTFSGSGAGLQGSCYFGLIFGEFHLKAGLN
ncbi:hypothetical protein SAMN04487894_102265 [Niabella drilacis]|uniref:Uncharacterized protein n=1 Tax=Niabella drilacis (strain DSM 25811 / CCM 8410 / CCUG 62505 / LMG 26954 / E90) TaxID=1285928 RepID=A0A1G6L8V5_NIADE|nr:hypothetical protein SAMN04487894_102265 [Niabella drilacis]